MIPSRIHEQRAYPSNAGAGFRFLRLGELIRRGDAYFSAAGQWHESTAAGTYITPSRVKLYRRKS
ncbi:hypothetical protein [Oleiharenicola lentus]|uniref:hypothetical protein n=1 Tax=Oleiharenicola lentus TaxID=2508720 RepID=UPI003F6620EB